MVGAVTGFEQQNQYERSCYTSNVSALGCLTVKNKLILVLFWISNSVSVFLCAIVYI